VLHALSIILYRQLYPNFRELDALSESKTRDLLQEIERLTADLREHR
jgi:hypothetical protein